MRELNWQFKRLAAMPLYSFKLPQGYGSKTIELPDDNEAWGKAIMLCGDILKDIDGALPHSTDMTLAVREGERIVATVRVIATLHDHISI